MIQRTPKLETVELHSESPQQTMDLGAKLAPLLKSGDLVALDGPLGSGKTLFVRGMAIGLNVDAKAVSSPTFVICQEYESNARGAAAGAIRGLVHIDAYRLSSPDELETIGWSEILAARDVVIAVEWAQRIANALPADRISIQFAHAAGESQRTLHITAPATILRALAQSVASASPSSNAVNCRTCGTLFDRTALTFPFCSDRCRLADLNQWFKGAYKMSRELRSDEELSD